jgi:hypothetical protein
MIEILERLTVVMCAAGGLLGATSPTLTEYPTAGIQPQQRPEGAPVVRDLQKPPGWYGRALTGVSQPYPHSLRFLEDQGNWYTPFNHPGMTGRYDIRGWYGR